MALHGFKLPAPKPKSKRKPRQPKVVDESLLSPVIEVSQPGKRDVNLLLANKFNLGGKTDSTGWWMSEKRSFSHLTL